MQEIFQMLQYLIVTYFIDIITVDFNYDIVKVLLNKILDIFTDTFQKVNKPTHASESSTEHAYMKKSLMEELEN